MSGAEASYAKFSNSPLVRGDNSSFEPTLFNKVGGIRGCTGATNNVAAANSNPGDNYKLVGGSRSNYVLNKNLPNLQLHRGGKRRRRKSHKKRKRSTRYKRSRHRRSRHRRHKRGGNPNAVPSGYAKGIPSFGYGGADLATTSKLSPGHAPVEVSYNTSCKGGSPQGESLSKRLANQGAIINHGKERDRRSNPLANRRAQQERARQQANDPNSAKLFGGKKKRRTYKKRRNSRKSLKKRMKSRRRKSKRCCKCKCKTCKCKKCPTKRRSRRHRMKGGYSQFMSNIPYSASYSTGGNISPSNLALANPAPHQRFVNCPGK